MGDSLTVRLCHQDDFEDVVALGDRFKKYLGLYPRAAIGQDIDSGHVFGAFQERKLVGYGDAKNLRLRHPLAALGFVYGLRSTILTEEPDKAEWIIDLLHKLGNEDDAYHAVGLLMIQYSDDVALEEGDDAADQGDNPLADAGIVAEENPQALIPEPVDPADLAHILGRLPKVTLLFDERADEIHPARFLSTMVHRVVAATPVNRHKEARRRMKEATSLSPSVPA